MVLWKVVFNEWIAEDGLNQFLFGELLVPLYPKISLLQPLREDEQLNPCSRNDWIKGRICANVMIQELDAALKVVLSPACRSAQQFTHELLAREIWKVSGGINYVSWPHIFLKVL